MPCFKNGQEIAQIALTDRAFHYGDGCFSTARLRMGCMELQDLHMARLQHANERLRLNADLAQIQRTLQHIAEMDELASGTLKIVLSRGEGQRGYSLPDHPADVWVFYTPNPVQHMHYDVLDSCGVLEQRIGISMPNLTGLKSLNRLEQVMLKAEADSKGWLEALAADVQGQIVEGVSSNCFIRINDAWITPELRYNGVHGVMRAEILSRMQAQGIDCQLRSVGLEEITDFQSMFFCNALHPMKIASSLQGAPLNIEACITLFNTLQLDQIR